MDQTIMRFASTAARDAAFGGANEPVLAEGMFAYTTDTNTLWLYNGSSWVNVLGSDIGEQALSNRNVVINGAMQVAQRGTSVAGITTTGYYTADRWVDIIVTLGTWTQSQEADAPTGSGFRNSTKILCTTADASPSASDEIKFQQSLEGQNVQQFLKGTASAKPFALSFWVKSNLTGTYIVELIDADNSRQVSASYTISASATWEKKTIIFPADTTGAFDNNNDASLRLNFILGAGSTYTSGTLNTVWASTTNANRYVGQINLAAATNNYWQITGVQLEAGSVATPFEFEDFSTTLAKCQRYLPALIGISNQVLGVAANTADARVTVPFLVTPRVAPTGITVSSLSHFSLSNPTLAGGTPTAISFVFAGTSAAVLGVSVAVGSPTIAAGTPVQINTNNASALLLFTGSEL